MSADQVPSEVSLQWVYMPPLLVMILFGLLGAFALGKTLNAIGWSRYFWRPEIAFLAFWIMLSSLIGLFLLPP